MAKKHPFTEEQIRILEQNCYTHAVSPNKISFTLEFKQFFVDQVRHHRKKTSTILQEAGYDISFFEKGNISSIRQHILEEANSPTGLKPPKGLSNAEKLVIFEKKDLTRQGVDASIKELQERLVHLERQVEFLKKTSRIVNTSTEILEVTKKQDNSLR